MASIYCKYNSTGTTQICYEAYNFSDIKVNGVSIGLVTSYNLNADDVVEFVLKFINVNQPNIPDAAFRGCEQLVSVEINEADTRIGKNAFNSCYNLEDVILGNGVLWIGDWVFYQCFSLKSIVIPNSVTRFGEGVFENCYSLKDVIIGDSVSELKNDVFANCKSLENVTIGKNVTSIGVNVFKNCINLRNIIAKPLNAPSIIDDQYQDTTFDNIGINGVLIYPENSNYNSWLAVGYYRLGKYGWNQGNENIIVPDIDLSEVPDYSIICRYNTTGTTQICYNLYSFSDIKVNGVSIGLVTSYNLNADDVVEFVLKGDTIVESTFAFCYFLASVGIGKGVKKIENGVFSNCYPLRKIIIPDSVESMGYSVFARCSQLTYVEIGRGCKKIGDAQQNTGAGFFSRCPNLKTIKITSPNCVLGFTDFFSLDAYETIKFNNKLYSYLSIYGTLYYPEGSDYSTWLSTDPYYLGYYGWNGVEIDVPDEPDNPIILEYNTLNVPQTGIVTTLGIQTNGVTNIGHSLLDWVDITNKGNYYEIDVSENPYAERTGTITFYGDNDIKTDLKIIQTGKEGIDTMATSIKLNKMRAEIPAGGGFDSVEVKYFNAQEVNTPYCSENWVTITKMTDMNTVDNGDNVNTAQYKITLTPSSVARQTKIKFSCINSYGEETSENKFVVYQAAPETTITGPYIEAIYDYYGTDAIVLCGNSTWFDKLYVDDILITKTTSISGLSQGKHNIKYTLNGNRLPSTAFYNAKYMEQIHIPSDITELGEEVFSGCYGLKSITIDTPVAPEVLPTTFKYIATDGTLYYPNGSDYSQWLSTDNYYLGCYGWNGITFDPENPDIPDEPDEDNTGKIAPFVTVINIDADGEYMYDSINVGYKNIVSNTYNINGSWIHLQKSGSSSSSSSYDEVVNYSISFDENTGAERVGTITFSGTDKSGNFIESVVTITQAGVSEEPDEPEKPEEPEDSEDVTYSPIWKDVEYTFGGTDVTYGIYVDIPYLRPGGGLVYIEKLLFKGRAYAAPDETVVKVNINKICQNYMSENPNIFNGSTGVHHSYNEFKLKNDYGTLLHTYKFINDWSYKNVTLGLKTNPIVPYIGDGQKLFFSVLAQDQKTIKWGMSYYDGKADYNNTEYIEDDYVTTIVPESRQKGVEVFHFGSKTYRKLPKCQCKYVLYYMNPYGGFDWFPITGRVIRKDSLQTYTVTQNYNNTTTDFGKKRYLSSINVSYQINTQWITQEQSDRMWELLESNTVWLHSLEDDVIMPVIIKDTEVEYKQKTNSNRKLSYQINVELSQTRERV